MPMMLALVLALAAVIAPGYVLATPAGCSTALGQCTVRVVRARC